MHTDVYEKSPNFGACWFASRFANVIAWCPLFGVAYAMTGSTNYYTTIATDSPLYCLVLNIRLNDIPENSSEQQCLATTSNTVRGLGYLVRWSVTQDNVRLIVTSPVLYLVTYNFCNDLWSRCASINLVRKLQIKFSFLESIPNFSIFYLQKSSPWKLKSSSKSGKSQNCLYNAYNRPTGAISPPLNTTDLSKGKRKYQTFLKKDLTFCVTGCTWFAASLLVNCQYVQNSLELVKNLMQIMHNT